MTLRKTLFTGVAMLAALAAAPMGAAQAENGRNAAAAVGVLGGIAAGAAIAGAANQNHVYVGRPQVIEEEDDQPVCHYERQRVELPDGAVRIRHVRVCE